LRTAWATCWTRRRIWTSGGRGYCKPCFY
jgi:hypothetical protein